MAAALNWSGNAKRWTDGINLWPNAVLAFDYPLGKKLYVWVFDGFLYKLYRNNFENLKKLNDDLRDTLLHQKNKTKIDAEKLST